MTRIDSLKEFCVYEHTLDTGENKVDLEKAANTNYGLVSDLAENLLVTEEANEKDNI